MRDVDKIIEHAKESIDVSGYTSIDDAMPTETGFYDCVVRCGSMPISYKTFPVRCRVYDDERGATFNRMDWDFVIMWKKRINT